mmetsp:Transcript_35147/g.91196  ORF Transcript_35147/g.91196 Transcript_35147/m.91196 type:complete len:128 (-) Transcript_35147:502-885(-)
MRCFHHSPRSGMRTSQHLASLISQLCALALLFFTLYSLRTITIAACSHSGQQMGAPPGSITCALFSSSMSKASWLPKDWRTHALHMHSCLHGISWNDTGYLPHCLHIRPCSSSSSLSSLAIAALAMD